MKTVLRTVTAAGLVLGLASCSAEEPATTAPVDSKPAPAGSPAPAATTAVRTLPGTDAAPFDQERTLRAPAGWQVTVWARVPGARLLAWTPDKQLLVSRPKSGDVLALTPGGTDAVPQQRTLAAGLTQPHGLAFDGSTLYVAESDQIDSYSYHAGAVSGRKVVVDGLPDAKSPELHGAYAHALKSVAVGKDHALYFSIGSTGNVSPEDREADPQRHRARHRSDRCGVDRRQQPGQRRVPVRG